MPDVKNHKTRKFKEAFTLFKMQLLLGIFFLSLWASPNLIPTTTTYQKIVPNFLRGVYGT